MDKVSKAVRSKTMSAIRGSDTKMEVEFRKVLFSKGIRYRKNVAALPGKPDIAIKKCKIVVFLDSCFWHACPDHFRTPSSNKKYWNEKIIRNKKRDKEVNRYYKNAGWVCLRFWEHELKNKKAAEKAVRKLLLQIGYF